MGRERVLAAAVDLLDRGDLADMLSFLGLRAVASAADVQPATVHHHFRNRDDNSKTNARLAAAVLKEVIGAEIGQESIAQINSVSGQDFHDVDEIRRLSSIAAANLEALIQDSAGVTGTFVAAAVARNDPAARTTLQDHYLALTRDCAELLVGLAEHFDRNFNHADGFTPEAVAVFVIALGDGLILRYQIEPDDVDAELFGELLIGIFEAVTITRDQPDSPAEAVTERLLAGVGTLQLPADSGLDHAKRAGTVDAVRKLYETAGADGITVTAVAREANVSRGTVIANFGDRCGLAAAVWAHFLPELERGLTADRNRKMAVGRIIERHLHRLIDLAKSHRELTALLLDGVLSYTIRHGAPSYADPADPRTLVPLPMLLVPTVRESAPHLRPGVAGTPAEAVDVATTITNLTMLRGLARPQETTSATVHHIMDLVLDGILARNRDRAGE